MIFAREISDDLTGLVKKIDAATKANAEHSMCSFIVFLNDDPTFGDKLKTWSEKAGLKELIVATDRAAGPEGYEIHKDAAVTVVLYVDRQIEVNQAFKKGELNAKAVDKVVAELPKILPKK